VPSNRDPSIPVIEPAPRRVPFPRLTPPTSQPTTPSVTGSANAPSARLRSAAPSTRTTRTTRPEPSANLPIAPTRPVDRDKILERYGRSSGGSRDSAVDGARSSPNERGPSARVAPSGSPPSRTRPTDASRSNSRERVEPTRSSRDAKPTADAKSNGSTLDSIRQARDDYRAKQAQQVSERRSQFADRESKAVTARRDQFRSAQDESATKRKAIVAAQRTQKLRQLEATNPDRARVVKNQGDFIAYANSVALGVSVSACGSWNWWVGWCSPWWCWNYWGDCGYGYWWNCGGYPYSSYCHPSVWPYYWWYGCWPYDIGYWWPYSYAYYYSPPVYYSTVVLDSYDDTATYVESQPAEEAAPAAQVGESVEYKQPATSAGGVLDRGPDSASRATTQYLSLGDRAFRERRYADAVHFYAKAVEFRPNDGVLYLVLSDALLATGDYHYGAFALRRALELDPTLADQGIDKHTFYSDPSDLDAQLQTLERYLADRPTDGDARLLLAANYLFSGKALLANDLLEAGASAQVREEPAGKLILAAAKKSIDSKK
jgi:hypothetical protein